MPVQMSDEGRAELLPSRPVWGRQDAGPVPADGDPTRGRDEMRGICCSGGGIRAAAFSYGGLQTLNVTPERDGKSWYERAALVTAVSGGSYIAGSFAIVSHDIAERRRAGRSQPGDEVPVYAPGSPEDNRLRAHTRYLTDSSTQLAIATLGILYGLLLNLVPMLAICYLAATVLGATLAADGLGILLPDPHGTGWSVSYPLALWLALLGSAGLGLAVYAVVRVRDVYRPLPTRAATRWCMAALSLIALAGLGFVLLVVVPWLLELLSAENGPVATVPAPAQLATLAGTVCAILGIVTRLVRSYRTTLQVAPAGSPASSASLGDEPAGVVNRLRGAVLPWLGSALIVALFAAAMLTWTSNMATGRDRMLHWALAGAAAAVLVVWQAVTDPNRDSLHRHYMKRLGSAFAVGRGPDGTAQPLISAPLLSQTAQDDGPALIVCATANTDQVGVAPTGRRCAPFTFSPHRAGISSGTMFRGTECAADVGDREDGDDARLRWQQRNGRLSMPTADYERAADPAQMTIMDAVAVSGAAVSPSMGRATRPALRLLLGVANVRLGMWLPNPLHDRHPSPPGARAGFLQRLGWQLRQPGIVALFREILGGITLSGNWLYVTDGGHYENLGLVEALRRGVTEVIVFDASGDQPWTWSTFGQAVETARTDLGVEITLDLRTLEQAGTTGKAQALVATGMATYPNGVRARIYLCKLAMIDDVPWDVHAWQHNHRDFPHDSTAGQLYGDREFEAYRRLGQAAAEQAMALIGARDDAASAVPTAVPAADPPRRAARDHRTAHPARDRTVSQRTVPDRAVPQRNG